MLNSLLSPAVYFMGRLSFKIKIILSTSILFLLLVLPSFTVIKNFIEKRTIYKEQLLTLSYAVLINNFVTTIQLHRGYMNGYMNGEIELKKNILDNEKILKQNWTKLTEFDKRKLNILKLSNLSFQMDFIGFDSISPNSKKNAIFKKHTNIIKNTYRHFDTLAGNSNFKNTKIPTLDYLAIITQKIISPLKEQIGLARGELFNVSSLENLTTEQKKIILIRYTAISSLKKLASNARHYFDLKNNTNLNEKLEKANKNIDSFLKQIDNIITERKDWSKSPKELFFIATTAINSLDKLFLDASTTYKKTAINMSQQLLRSFLLTMTGFFLIILSALYVFSAFFISIKTSMKKLKSASTAIISGNFDVDLKITTQDEIGDAFLAFNKMSEALNTNTAFLNGYKLAIDASSIVTKTDTKGIITYANKLFCEISGYKEGELIGKPHNIIRHPDMPKAAFKELWETIKDKKIWKGIVENRAKDGSSYIVDATVLPILNNKGETVEYISVRHDFTELEKTKEELKNQKIDLLTGLPNRNQLIEDLKTEPKIAILYLNINNFNALNNFYGTKIGDEVLCHTSQTLKKISKITKSKLFKLGGDEFLLLFEHNVLTDISSQEIMSSIIERIEEKSKEKICITLCGGIVFCENKKEYKSLLSYAVLAKNIAKNNNKKFEIYKEDLNKNINYDSNMRCIKKVKNAIEEDRITVYYQPIIDNTSNKITKYETLVRMIDENGKVISPFFFLDISKKAHLYTYITKIVIDKSFETFKNLPQYSFSINLTIEDINNKETLSYLFRKLDSFPNPELFIVEITESEEIRNYDIIKNFIHKIKEYGAKVAIDDFGSGYASFEHILDLNADFIKIDGSLIKNIVTDKKSKILTESIIEFSKKLGNKTIAEFIHNAQVQKVVQEMGADFSQGFYLGEPSPKIV